MGLRGRGPGYMDFHRSGADVRSFFAAQVSYGFPGAPSQGSAIAEQARYRLPHTRLRPDYHRRCDVPVDLLHGTIRVTSAMKACLSVSFSALWVLSSVTTLMPSGVMRIRGAVVKPMSSANPA